MKKIALILVILIALVFITPIVFTATNSFMSHDQIRQKSVDIIPMDFNLNQYYTLIMEKGEYFKFFMNSVMLTGVIITGQIVLGIFAAFAFAKLEFKGRDVLFVIYILAILLPFQVTLVPNYIVMDKLQNILNIKILNTHLAIMLPGVFSSFGVFLLRQFIKGVPKEVVEAAKIDGASDAKILFRVVLPMMKPAIFSLVVLTFIDNWNLIEPAIVFLDEPKLKPLSVFLQDIFVREPRIFYAGAVLYIIPAVLVFVKGEKYLREGLIVGGK